MSKTELNNLRKEDKEVLVKNWRANLYDKINGVEIIVAYASFNSTNLLAMYGNRLVKSFDLLENGDFEIHLQEDNK